MNISLRARITISFILATLMILSVTFITFNYLNNLNKGIEGIVQESHHISVMMDEVRVSTISIIRYQGHLISEKIEMHPQ